MSKDMTESQMAYRLAIQHIRLNYVALIEQGYSSEDADEMCLCLGDGQKYLRDFLGLGDEDILRSAHYGLMRHGKN